MSDFEQTGLMDRDEAQRDPFEDDSFAFADDPGDIEVVDELEFDAIDDISLAPETSARRSEARGDEDAFSRFLRVAAEVAESIGLSSPSIAGLPARFGARPAWTAVLRGETTDLGECGALPLDEWAAQVIAEAAGNTALAPAARGELRRRGVLAFGVLAA
jgi:hypothetical protein